MFWEEHNQILAYVLIDFMQETIRRANQHANKLTMSMPKGYKPFLLQHNINEPYSEALFESFKQGCYFQKLTSQTSSYARERLDDGRLTCYGYILNRYRQTLSNHRK